MGPGRDRTRDTVRHASGIAVRHASVARHVTDCATRPGQKNSKNEVIMTSLKGQ